MKTNRAIKNLSVRELQNQGFKKTKIKGLYVSHSGKALNTVTGHELKPQKKGFIVFNKKQYNLAKLILETFFNIPIRTGRIKFKNNNTQDFSSANVEYKSTIDKPPPNPTDLIKCIRLYFEVDKGLKLKNPLSKHYLNEVIKFRGFESRFKELDFKMFLEYMQTEYIYLSKNQNFIFEKYGFSRTSGKNAINKYLNLLIDECLQDLEKGILKVKSFKQKPLTKTQRLKEIQKTANESGLNIKLPLRKQSTKEVLNKFHKKINELKKD
jgi:hypothetical protein